MRMLNGRRPRRPDDNFYRESRRIARRRRSRPRLGVATALILLILAAALVGWWLMRGIP